MVARKPLGPLLSSSSGVWNRAHAPKHFMQSVNKQWALPKTAG